MNDQPFFVVGASRSGTNLLRAVVNRHSEIWMSAETHYFDDLRIRLGAGDIPLDADARSRCETYFLALSHRAYGRGGDPDKAKISAGELRRRAVELGGTGDAYFRAFCELRARLHGKKRWAEKTPRHVYRVAEILEAFPDAKVVCLVRDPRAVVASYRDWHRGPDRAGLDEEDAAAVAGERARSRRSYNALLMSLLWRGVTRAEHDALRRFGTERILIQRYEELAEDPQRSLASLCSWLAIRFEPAMLDVPVVNSSYTATTTGVSSDPVHRWREKLSQRELAIIERCCGTYMDALGYSRNVSEGSLARYALAWAAVPYATVRATVANRGRLGKAVPYIRRRGRVAFSRRPLLTQPAAAVEAPRRDS